MYILRVNKLIMKRYIIWFIIELLNNKQKKWLLYKDNQNVGETLMMNK